MNSKILLVLGALLIGLSFLIPTAEAEFIVIGDGADWGLETFNDTFTKADSPTTAMGAFANDPNRLTLRDDCCTQEIFISFDWTGLLSGSDDITGAWVQLTEESGRTSSNGNVDIKHVEAWTPDELAEYTMTYNTRYTDVNGTAEDTTSVSNTDNPYNWTVTHAVQREWDDSNSSVSFYMVKTSGTSGTMDFYSKEGGSSTTRPRLYIEYTPGVVPPVITPGSNHTYTGTTADNQFVYNTANALSFEIHATVASGSLGSGKLIFDNQNITATNNTAGQYWHNFTGLPTIGQHNFHFCIENADGIETCSNNNYVILDAFTTSGALYTTNILEADTGRYNITINPTTNASWNKAYLNWNSTNLSYDFNSGNDYGATTFNTVIHINNTLVPMYWDVNIGLNNGTAVQGTTTSVNQGLWQAYFDAIVSISTGSYLEGTNVTVDTSFTDLNQGATVTPYVYYSGGQQKVAITQSYDSYTTWFELDSIDSASNNEWFNGSFNFSVDNNWRMINNSATFTNNQLLLVQCNGTYPTKWLEVQFFQENNFTTIPSGDVEFDVTFDLWNENVIRNVSYGLSGNTTYSFCLNPSWATFQANASAQYQDLPTFEQRTYYLNNVSVSNATTDLDLFLLDEAFTDLVTITVRQSGDLLQDAFVKVLRWYPELNQYRTVEIVKTDNEGKSPAYIDLYDVFYKFIVEKDLATLLETQQALISNENIELTVPNTNQPEYFPTKNGVGFDCTTSNTTSTATVSCVFTDTRNLMTNGCLTITQLGILESVVLSDTCATTAAGVIGYVINPKEPELNYQYMFYGKFSNDESKTIIFEIGTWEADTSQPLGDDGLFFMFLLYLTMVGFGLAFPRMIMILSVFVIGIGVALGLIEVGVTGGVALISAGLIFLWKSRDQE